MISEDFYPAAWSDSNVQGAPTQLVQNIPIITPEFTQAYWLGWVAWENVPQQYKISRYSIVNGKGVFTDVTLAENIPVGYTVNDDGSYVPAKINAAILTNNGDKWQNITYPNHTVTAGNNVRLPNSLNVNTVGYNGVVILGFVGFANTAEISGWVSIGINDFINDSNFTVTFTNGYVFTAKPSDFAEYTLTEFDDNDTHYSVALGMYKIDYVRDVTIYGGSYGYQGIRSMLQTRTTDDKSYIQSLTYPAHYQNNNTFNWGSGETGQGAYIDFSGNVGTGMVQNTDGVNVDIMGGFVGEFDISAMVSNGIIHPDDATFYIRGIGRSDLAIIGRIFTYTEIYKTLALAPRIAVTGVNQYVNNANFYYAKVDLDTNEFLTDFVSGDKIRELTDWQIIGGNISANEFTDDDIPEYEPGGDGDDQGSNTGSVLRPTTLGVGGTNGFITQYSMTAAQIAEIGHLLWLSFTDPDYYKNFLFTLTTTGTLNISNLLDYFVSLRVYPFPLINVPSHAAAGQDMWIGAGLVPLSFNTNLHTINNYADYIDAGSCTIPRYYNDFRDFAHTQIMLYLPYCGTVQLNPADVVGSTLHAQYAVDFATGGVTAYVDCTTWDGSQFVIAVLTGSIGADIPLTASNAAQIAARIAGDALNFAGTVGEAISSDVGRSAQAIGSAATGDVVGAAIGVANTYAGRIGGALDVAQTGLQIATAEGVKMPMLSGGRGFGSFGAPQTAYVQIRRGKYAEGQQPTQGFKEAYGEAYSKPVQVSSCTGFTVFANVDTSGIQCDAMEREQVKKMMQSGIYI